MKKLILTLLGAGICMVATESRAQEKGVDKSFYKKSYKERNIGSFSKSTSLFSIGYGFPNANGLGRTGAWGSFNTNYFGGGPLYLKYEHGLRDEVGIGGYVAGSFSRHKYSIGNRDYVDQRVVAALGVLGYYHFNKLIPVKSLDVYAGAGFTIASLMDVNKRIAPESKTTNTDLRVRPIAKVGARYFFTKGFGVYAETGYDYMSSGNLGITFRF